MCVSIPALPAGLDREQLIELLHDAATPNAKRPKARPIAPVKPVKPIIAPKRAELARPSTAASPETLVSIEETCRRLGGTSRSRLYKLIAERKLKTVKLGRRRFVIAQSIDDLIRRSAA